MTLTKAEELRIFLAASFVGVHSDILLDTDRLRSFRPFDFGKRNLTKKNILPFAKLMSPKCTKLRFRTPGNRRLEVAKTTSIFRQVDERV